MVSQEQEIKETLLLLLEANKISAGIITRLAYEVEALSVVTKKEHEMLNRRVDSLEEYVQNGWSV